MRRLLTAASALALFATPALAGAVSSTPAEPPASAKPMPAAEEKKPTTDPEGEKAVPAEGEAPASKKALPPANESTDPTEKAGQTYYFLGLRYRHSVVPSFMIHLFAKGGPDIVSVPSFGLEAAMRRDGNEQIFSLTYRDWGMSPFGFHGNSDGDNATEVVSSSLKMIMAQVDLLWSTNFSPQFSFQYGLTAGVGAVFGDLKRVWGEPANPSDPASVANIAGYVPCGTGPGDTAAVGMPFGPLNSSGAGGNPNYCQPVRSNKHFGGYIEPSWFNGGSVPNIYAALGPQLSFRWKPIKQVVARIDVGFDFFSGFFFGAGLNYGL